MSYITNTNKLEMILNHADEYAHSKYYFKKYGFIKYTLGEHQVFLNDIYVEPDYRDKTFAQEILKNFKEYMEALGVKEVITSIYKTCADRKISLHLAKTFGMELVHEDIDKIILRVEL